MLDMLVDAVVFWMLWDCLTLCFTVLFFVHYLTFGLLAYVTLLMVLMRVC